MKNVPAAISAPATTIDEAMDILREANGLCEEAPPASKERPSLHLVTPPPAVTEVEPETAPEVAPLAHTCSKCGAQVADLAGVWSAKHGMCRACAAPLLRKEESANRKQAKTCKCGNWKREDAPLCRDCYEQQKAERENVRKASEATKLVCPKCGSKKDEAYHKMCRSCFTASRPAPVARPQARKANGRQIPEYKVDPKAQKRAEERSKLAQVLLATERAGELDKSYPGAKVTKDDPGNAQVCIAYNGESYTLVDPAKVKNIAERKAEAAKAAQAAQAEAARKAAEAKREAARLAKLNKSNKPKKGKKDKSSDSSDAKPTKAERKAARKGK